MSRCDLARRTNYPGHRQTDGGTNQSEEHQQAACTRPLWACCIVCMHAPMEKRSASRGAPVRVKQRKGRPSRLCIGRDHGRTPNTSSQKMKKRSRPEGVCVAAACRG